MQTTNDKRFFPSSNTETMIIDYFYRLFDKIVKYLIEIVLFIGFFDIISKKLKNLPF